MEQTINVNLTPNNTLPRVYVSQYDVQRQFYLKLSEGALAYSVPSGTTLTLQGTKPSGLGFSTTCEVDANDRTKVIVQTDAEMTDEWGDVEAELVLTKNSTVIGSTNILLSVERSPHPTGTIDGQAEQLVPALTALVERVEDAAESIHDLTVTALTGAPGSEAMALYDSEINEIFFIIPRGSQVTCTDANADGNIVMAFS